MRKVLWTALAGAALLCATTLRAQDLTAEETGGTVTIPLTGLKAACCDAVAKTAIESQPGVAGVTIEKDEAGKKAVVTMKSKDATIDLSKMQAALDAAAKDMGAKMSMKLEYKVDGGVMLVDDSVLFRTSPISAEDKTRLEATLDQVKGYGASKVENPDKDSSLLSLTFDPALAPTLDGARKILADAKIAVKDILFRGIEAEAATGYTCPMCGGDFAKPGDCPKCGMALVEKVKGQPEKKGG